MPSSPRPRHNHLPISSPINRITWIFYFSKKTHKKVLFFLNTTLLANQRGPLCVKDISSAKSIKRNLFSEINKKAILKYRLMASRSNCCFLYRGVDRDGHLKASASEPVQKFSEQ